MVHIQDGVIIEHPKRANKLIKKESNKEIKKRQKEEISENTKEVTYNGREKQRKMQKSDCKPKIYKELLT